MPITSIVALLIAATSAWAQKDLPDVTDDGLEKVDTRRLDALYWRPDATLAPYQRVNILEPYVAFRKNWERDQNRDRRGVYRVDAEVMDAIRTILAEEFISEFTRELQERGDYEITDEVGEDVLLLRPAIVNLDVNSPDIDTPERSRSYVASAGQMTLYMELFDSATNEIIGRVIDQREGMDTGNFQVSNRVTNRAEADRILRSWASTLRDALDDQWDGSR